MKKILEKIKGYIDLILEVLENEDFKKRKNENIIFYLGLIFITLIYLGIIGLIFFLFILHSIS